MSDANLDQSDIEEYQDFLDARGLNPKHFQVAASEGDPAEGEFAPSRRTVTVTQTVNGTAQTYSFRTWVADFKADQDAGLFNNSQASQR